MIIIKLKLFINVFLGGFCIFKINSIDFLRYWHERIYYLSKYYLIKFNHNN